MARGLRSQAILAWICQGWKPGLPDRARLGALREAQDLAALRQFEDLRPALAAGWGEARTAALGRTILGLRFTEALGELESATGQGAHAECMSSD